MFLVDIQYNLLKVGAFNLSLFSLGFRCIDYPAYWGKLHLFAVTCKLPFAVGSEGRLSVCIESKILGFLLFY